MRPRSILLALAGLFTMQGCTVEMSTPEPSASKAYPPALGQPVVLDARVPDWETSAWLAEDAFCVRAARRKREEGKENEYVSCDPAPSALDAIGPPLLPAKPLPYIVPLDPQQRKIILVGAVRGAVDSVSVTMFGQTATAAVHPLPATGGRQVGAYAVWLPRSTPGRNSMDLSEVTAVVGSDTDGNVVTRLD